MGRDGIVMWKEITVTRGRADKDNVLGGSGGTWTLCKQGGSETLSRMIKRNGVLPTKGTSGIRCITFLLTGAWRREYTSELYETSDKEMKEFV